MSCTHIWISRRRGFEVSFKTLSINSPCYDSAEHHQPTCICPPLAVLRLLSSCFRASGRLQQWGKPVSSPQPQDRSQSAHPDLQGPSMEERPAGKRQSPSASPLWELRLLLEPPLAPAFVLGNWYHERAASVRVGRQKAEECRTSPRQ